MPLSRLYDNKVLDLIFGAQTLTAPGILYIGLSTTTPAKDGSGVTEPTGGAYARVAVVNNLTNFPAAVTSSKSNGIVVQFPEPTVSWGQPTYIVVFDALTVGSLIAYGVIPTPKTLNIGSNVNIPLGLLIATVS